ncbi:glycosyltransferase family 2 protein [Phaeobacter sp. C3_T13_0]|uniref:glycosyltransferase family 2 protein n=1 Tax=Phaeobacter cretensis TaxID=3342641 RepID=UPI0039BD2B45
MTEPRPQISVIMANRDAAAHLPLAIRAVLAQTIADLELIIVDDASNDDSWQVISDAAALDPRIRAVRRQSCGGPAVARNDALALARGDWIAICDSDDSQHPLRLEQMLTAAQDLGADMVADDMILFSDQPMARAETILGAHAPRSSLALTLKDVVLSGVDPKSISHIGYLKPLIRRSFLKHVRYNTALRVGEDHDLYLRLILAGANMYVLPMAGYLYRRHPTSVSYRNMPEDLAAQIYALDRLVAQTNREDLVPLAGMRRQALVRRHAQLELARDVRAGRCWSAILRGLQRVDHLPWLMSVLRNRLELKLQIAISRLWRRRQCWRLGAHAIVDGREATVTTPTDVDGQLDISASAAPIWAKLCCAASRRSIEAEVTDPLGASALWMLPRIRTHETEAHFVAKETRERVAVSPETGSGRPVKVAVGNSGRSEQTKERDDTDG